MAQQEQKSNTIPLIIIGLVFLAVIAGGWWIYSSSQKNSNAGNGRTSPTPGATDTATVDLYNSAPPGAQPPHTLGSPTAAVTVEEFADFQCPTCASVHTIMKQVNTMYGGRIRFVFRHFPLTQIHPNANLAAAAAEAAGLQGKFWDMQNLLFLKQREWSNAGNVQQLFEQYAESIGLDKDRFVSDLNSMPVRLRINNDVQRGQALRITGTPSVFVNGRQIPFSQMSVQGLSQIIDYELKAAQDKAAAPQNSSAEANRATNTAKTETDQ